MQEKTIRHLCEADTDDLPITKLRTLLELVRNAIIFSKVLRRHKFTKGFVLVTSCTCHTISSRRD